MKASITILFLLSVPCIHPVSADERQVRIAVYKIKSEVLPEAFTEALTDHIESKILTYAGYRVISRSNLDVLITEDNLSQSGITDNEVRMNKNGSRSTVDKICTGSISRIGKSYSFTLKIIDVESGRIDAAAQQIFSGPAEGLLDIGSNLLQKLLSVDSTRNYTSDTIRTVTGPDSTKSPIQTIQPVTRNTKEDISPSTSIQRNLSIPTSGNSLSTGRPATGTSGRKLSDLGKKISIGAVFLFGTLAAIVLLTRNEQ
jgi:TolB-like protein